jgi:uncharacterized protein YegP (UPF0339 family)
MTGPGYVQRAHDVVEFYQDVQGEWRWRAKNGDNGNIVADSSEGYENKEDCESAAHDLFFYGANVIFQNESDGEG